MDAGRHSAGPLPPHILSGGERSFPLTLAALSPGWFLPKAHERNPGGVNVASTADGRSPFTAVSESFGGRVSARRPDPAALEARSTAAENQPGMASRRRRHATALLAADAAAVVVAVVASVVLRQAGTVHGPPLRWTVVFGGLTLGTLILGGAYDRLWSAPLIDEFSGVVAATVAAALVAVALRLGLDPEVGMASQAGRLWAVVTAAVLAARLGRRLARRCGYSGGRRNALIVGADHVGQLLAARLLVRPELGLRPVGFLAREAVGDLGVDLPVLGDDAELVDILRRHRVDTVLFSFASEPHTVLLRVARQCRRLGLDVAFVPRLLEEMSGRIGVERLGGLTLLRVNQVDPDGWQFRAKYALDRLFAALLLGLCAPLLAVIAVAVRVGSPGPVLFRQWRLGREGRAFQMLKFRTMVGSPETHGEADSAWLAAIAGAAPPPQTSRRDRSTPVGRLLRRFSLDELPQLINVVRGEMSLVGPRPERISPATAFGQCVYRYDDRHRVKPGMTGWAQVHGLRGETSLSDRTEWDNYYIENWSPGLDVKILLMTVPAMVGSRSTASRDGPRVGVSGRRPRRLLRGRSARRGTPRRGSP